MVITIFNSLLFEFHIVLDYNLDNADTSCYGSLCVIQTDDSAI